MNISIIAVGSELLLGQIANTNGQYLSKLFNQIGKNIVEHTVIGDNPDRLEFIIREGLKRFDTLVLTGGLGPTKDDLTKQTVAKVLNKNLVTNEEALNYIEDFFKEQGQEMTPNNKQQALVVEGAKVLKNHYGMAPGMFIEMDNKKVILLPGPPSEMQPMAKNELLPLLIDNDNTIFSEQLRFAGIGESKVETELMDLIEKQTNPTIAPLAGKHEVYIRLTANASTQSECKTLIQPIKEEILERIGQFYYGSDDTLLEQSVMEQMNSTVSIYDGVTDGAIYTRLKRFDKQNILKGILPDNDIFLNHHSSIEMQLRDASSYVKDLYKTEMGITILHEKEEVYLAINTKDDFKMTTFKITQSRNILPNRSQNYVLIRLLNWH
ncbi:CinA family nicotinamide mononucleotide deamidase-related protein [Staphylococcus hominis]|uniref:CinA family nicotinamide mononucleotide deamidase-related protein n=1 Tax=Staphylococcus hominis TaxID=1290 RepID=UPI00200FEC90|nr:CinA family nicotinamide mononucleotide deamidase-related protein [Staphylococcus hominis]UQA64551.1 CinA family nicotinamide mononucleotide deamidase-related protein [Staphylococcus hominis subsp. hominis]